MLIEETPFILTICSRPDNERGPREVYADFLEEQGECERAEFWRSDALPLRSESGKTFQWWRDDTAAPGWDANHWELPTEWFCRLRQPLLIRGHLFLTVYRSFFKAMRDAERAYVLFVREYINDGS